MAKTGVEADGFPRSVGNLKPLTAAERKVVAACVQGAVAEIGDAVPEAADDAVRVRAGLIRVMALGGDADHRTHERGVRIKGGFVEEKVDLAHYRLIKSLWLEACCVSEGMDLEGARLADLLLKKNNYKQV